MTSSLVKSDAKTFCEINNFISLESFTEQKKSWIFGQFSYKNNHCAKYIFFSFSPLFADNLGAHHKASTLAIFLFCLFVVLQFLSPFFCKALVFFQSAIWSEVGTSKLCLHGKLENEIQNTFIKTSENIHLRKQIEVGINHEYKNLSSTHFLKVSF